MWAELINKDEQLKQHVMALKEEKAGNYNDLVNTNLDILHAFMGMAFALLEHV